MSKSAEPVKDKPVLIAKARDRMPDHLLYATLQDWETKQIVARRVLTEIYTPESHRGKVDVIFHPGVEHVPALQFVPAVSVYGRSPSRFVLRADEVWHELETTGMQDGIRFMYPCKGHATNLEIRQSLVKPKNTFLKTGTFWLTDCRLINTGMILKHHYGGSVRAKQIVKPTFTLRSGVRLAFKKHFGTDRDTGSKLAQLVAEFKPKARLPVKSVQNVIADLDGLLLLVSFAARRRRICTGWSYADENGNFTEYYRRGFVLPPDAELDLNNCLISIRSLMKFLRKAYETFVRSLHQDLIRNAIYALTSEGGSSDNRFLRLFAGLESILLHVERVHKRLKPSKLRQKVAFF